MVSGIINKMWTKNVNTKYGEKPVALFSLEGEDKVFNLGFGKQEVREGDEVSFSYDGPKYGEFQVDKSTVKIQSRDNKFEEPKEAPKPAAPSGSSGGGKSYSRGNFPLDFTDGQRSILRQHAFTQASEIARESTRLEGDGIDDDKVFVDHIIDVARKIEYYTSGDELRDEMK